MLWRLSKNSIEFPDIEDALDEHNGLLAIGGDLSTERLLNAYKSGIFPWYSDDSPLAWYSPNPRMVITPKSLKISKSLQKIINQNSFVVQINNDFASVIKACATITRKDEAGTWITKNMQTAYLKLHKLGFSHSIEVYQNQQLVGGLYGVAIGRVFFGESMFSHVSNTSKIALVHLLTKMPYDLVDCQVENPHLKKMGAFNLDRQKFLQQIIKLSTH